MTEADQASQLGQIVVMAWRDEQFKKRLLANPASVLKEVGLEMPPGVQVKFVEDTETLRHVVLPPKPADRELSDDDLAQVAGGWFWNWTQAPKPTQGKVKTYDFRGDT